MNARKSPTPFRYSRMNQARLEEEEKVRERDRKDRGQEADGKKGTPTKQKKKKNIGGIIVKATSTAQVDKLLPNISSRSAKIFIFI